MWAGWKSIISTICWTTKTFFDRQTHLCLWARVWCNPLPYHAALFRGPSSAIEHTCENSMQNQLVDYRPPIFVMGMYSWADLFKGFCWVTPQSSRACILTLILLFFQEQHLYKIIFLIQICDHSENPSQFSQYKVHCTYIYRYLDPWSNVWHNVCPFNTCISLQSNMKYHINHKAHTHTF